MMTVRVVEVDAAVVAGTPRDLDVVAVEHRGVHVAPRWVGLDERIAHIEQHYRRTGLKHFESLVGHLPSLSAATPDHGTPP